MRCPKIKGSLFYILSFTWGLPMTLVGLATALVLVIGRKRPGLWHGRFHFSFGAHWGGISLGIVFLTQENASKALKDHECGHTIQNCLYGFFMPFLVGIPSMGRYWWRQLRQKLGAAPKKPYDAIWFERQATQWGGCL